MQQSPALTPAQAQQILWRKGNLDFLLHDGQLEIKHTIENLDPSVREFVVLCSRRFGKSYLGICLALSKCLQTPGARVAIIGPTYVHTQRIILPLLKNHVAATAPKGLFYHTKSEFMWRFANGSELIISSFEGAVETLRGQYLDLALIEESALASSDNYEYIINSVVFPTLLHSRGKIIHLTTPAHNPLHHFNHVVIPKMVERGHLIKKTIYENPLLTDTDIQEACLQSGGEHSAHWQREYLCNIILDKSTLVIPAFKNQHVSSNLITPAGAKFLVSGDWGGMRDFSVFHAIYFDYNREKIVPEDELSFKENTPTAEILSKLIPFCDKYGVQNERFIDANGQTLVDLSNAGFHCRLPIKTDWAANLESLNSKFHMGEIEINSKCELLVRTLNLARFNRTKSDLERESSIGHCDALMSLAYGFRHVDTTPPKVTYNRNNTWVPRDYEDNNLVEIAKAFGPNLGRRRRQ